MKQFKSKNGSEIGRFVSAVHTAIRGLKGYYSCYYVNLTDKYISIKIESKHLTNEELAEFERQIKESVWKDRFVKIYNNTGNRLGYKFEKVNIRFTKL